jgi:bifunctional UDP-N-acetylglucosamine pyrophosphorylase/glucosamine-1-phosphate N-acetyltransferase
MSDKSELSVIILAAGEGTRMKSKHPKVLFTVCGRPMLSYVLDAAASLSPRRIVVVLGYQGEQVKEGVNDTWAKDNPYQGCLEFVWQAEQRGTGHAAKCASGALSDFAGDVLVLYGDATPLLPPDLLRDFYQDYLDKHADLSLVTGTLDDPGPYGRVVRTPDGSVARIVEARDLTPAEAGIREINSGIYVASRATLSGLLDQITDDNAKHEFYLTDIVHIGNSKGLRVAGFLCRDSSLIQGINDRHELGRAEEAKRREILKDLALAGVTVRDPASTYVDYGVAVGPDTVIEPQTYIRGKTRIGSGCLIGPGAEIANSSVGDGARVWLSVVEGSDVGENVQIGPYSHLRPNTVLSPGVLVGNFAEVKNSIVGPGSKAHHHCYLGDSDIGRDVNIGAGTITVNYDGTRKHRTVIEDGVFVGCNANLIAPVKIGKGAYVAAGSTINLDVPGGCLAIARERQVNKEGWVARRKQQGR